MLDIQSVRQSITFVGSPLKEKTEIRIFEQRLFGAQSVLKIANIEG